MQEKIHRLSAACARADMSVDDLLRKPLEDIVVFAQESGIGLADVRDICQLLIQRLDDLDAECATFEQLISSDANPTSSSMTLAHG